MATKKLYLFITESESLSLNEALGSAYTCREIQDFKSEAEVDQALESLTLAVKRHFKKLNDSNNP